MFPKIPDQITPVKKEFKTNLTFRALDLRQFAPDEGLNTQSTSFVTLSWRLRCCDCRLCTRCLTFCKGKRNFRMQGSFSSKVFQCTVQIHGFHVYVVGENGEWQLWNGNCTTARNCSFQIWYAKTMGSLRGAKLGSSSNHDDDGNKNHTNLHIGQWKTVFLHALHVHLSSFDILKTFSFFQWREMTFFAVVWTTCLFSRAIAVRQLTFVFLPDNISWNSYIHTRLHKREGNVKRWKFRHVW